MGFLWAIEKKAGKLSLITMQQLTCALHKRMFCIRMYSQLLKNVIAMSFLKDLKPVLLLFIIGDTLTTIYALRTGYFYEGNPVLSWFFMAFGYNSLITIKLSFLFILYHVYKNADRFYWNVTRYSVACIGLLATTSNMIGIINMS